MRFCRNLFKIIFLLVVFIFSEIFAQGMGPEFTINPPVGITTSGFTLTWGTSAGYHSYLVVITSNGANLPGYPKWVTDHSVTVTGLAPSTLCYFEVTAYYPNGSGIYSRGGSCAWPYVQTLSAVPENPIASAGTSVTQTSFYANWGSSARATKYFLDVATDNLFTSFVTGFNSKDVSNVTTYSITGLTLGATYYYRVRAYNLDGYSNYSNTITQKTLPDVTVSAAAGSVAATSFFANWNATTGATGYYLDVATDNLFNSMVAGFGSKDVGNVLTFQVTGLNPLTTYYYRVRAYNSGGASANSGTVTVATLPTSPVANAATIVTSDSFNANWNSVNGIIGYNLQVDTNPAFPSPLYNLSVGNNLTYTISNGVQPGTTYYYRVASYTNSQTSAWSNTITQTTLPNTPIVTPATLIATTSFNANWNAAIGASGYFLDVATDAAFNSMVAGFGNKDVSNLTTQSVTGLTIGVTYYYRVRAYSLGATVSPNSTTISVTTVPPIPLAMPSTLINQTTFNANWNVAIGAVGYYLDVATDKAFTVFVAGYNNKDVHNVTTFTVRGLTAGTTYYYRIRGYVIGAASASSNTIVLETLPPDAPIAPTGLAATFITLASFNANWNAVSNTDGYLLDVALDNKFTSFVSGYANKNVNNVTSFTVNGLTAGTTYYYRVRGYNSGGASIYSNIVATVTLPLAPNAPIAAISTLIKQTSFTLNWNAITGVTGYYIDVATDSIFTTFVAGCNNKDVGNVTSYTISGLTASTKYYYRVRGYNSSGVGPNSNVILVLTLPLAPTAPIAVEATLIQQTSFALNWNPQSGATGYCIDVTTDSTFNTFVSGCNDKILSNVTTFSLTGLVAGTKYYYRVRGYNSGGVSVNSNIISVLTLPLAPKATVATEATSILQTSFTLNWNPIAGAIGYYIDVATDSDFNSFVSGYNNKNVGNVTTITITGLSANTKYYYRVRGYNISGIGIYSNTISVTTLQIISNAPVARPASSVTQVSFVANWNLVPGVLGYVIDVATDNAFSSIIPAYNNKDIGNVSSIQITGLTVGTSYYYRLRAYNTGGASAHSIVIPVSTIPIEPTPPVADAGTVIGVTSFTANWNPSPNATGYYLDVSTDILFTTFVTGYSFRDVGNVLKFSITGLKGGTTYYFRVVGYNASGIGQYSNVIKITLMTTGIEQFQGTPTVFKLNQNYPNPFNPSTTISYSLPQQEFVTLKVYDSIGKEVAELVNETKQAGNYQIKFDASKLSSGIYFYQIKAGSFVQINKLILMK